MDDYKNLIKLEIYSKLGINDDFYLLNNIMMNLVNEGKVGSYYISKKMKNDGIGIRHLTFTSVGGNIYNIKFDNMILDYRDTMIHFII